jgi:nitrogen fixation NifU-like protein
MSDFWDKHSDRYLEMAFRTDRCEIISQPDGYGKNTGECGDTIEMFLTLDTDRIKWVAFDTDGCINTRACANTVAEMVEKKTLEAAWKVTAEDVIAYLETLPEDSHHCAELAVGALYRALTNARMNRRDSWKKLYQTKK